MSRFCKNILLSIVVFATAFTTGCYEPLAVDEYGNCERTIVIEGRITDGDSVSTVIVSRSVEATDTADCELVDGAIVLIRDDNGNSAQLENVGRGVYQTNSLVGVPGSQYLLTVEVDGDRFISIEQMPQRFLIDSIVVEYRDNYTIFDTIGYYVSVYSKPNSDSMQYYRIEIEQNGELLNDGLSLWLYEDSHLSGVYQMTIPHTFAVGDVVEVSVYSLSAAVYEYFSGLSKQFSSKYSNIQPPLTNPGNNINPTALGCFQASPVKVFRFVVGNKARTIVRLQEFQ